jgi:hypothetical protein
VRFGLEPGAWGYAMARPTALGDYNCQLWPTVAAHDILA